MNVCFRRCLFSVLLRWWLIPIAFAMLQLLAYLAMDLDFPVSCMIWLLLHDKQSD